MAGLFSQVGNAAKGLFSGLKDGDLVNRLAAARAFSEGDYGGGAGLLADGKREKLLRDKFALEKAEAERAQAVAEEAYNALVARGIPPAEARVIADSAENRAGYLRDVNKPWETGPGGGSRFNPIDKSWIGAPRWDDDGNYYGPSMDASKEPQRIIRGTKVVPVNPGGKAVALDSVTAEVVNGGGNAPAPFKKGDRYTAEDGTVYELIGDDDTDPASWRPVTGGATVAPSPTFPR